MQVFCARITSVEARKYWSIQVNCKPAKTSSKNLSPSFEEQPRRLIGRLLDLWRSFRDFT